MTMNKTLTFISKDNKKVSLEISVKSKLLDAPKRDYDTLEQVTKINVVSISGNCGNGCGQVVDDFVPTEAQKKLVDFWHEYHLNDLKAGTKTQTEALKDCPNMDFVSNCEYLESKGLLVDRGYKYGSDWLCKPVGDEEITTLENIIKEIEDEESNRKQQVKNVFDLNDDSEENIFAMIDAKREFFPDAKITTMAKLFALCKELGVSFSEINNDTCEIWNDCQFVVFGTDYYCGEEDELEKIAREYLDKDSWIDVVNNGGTELSFKEWQDDVINNCYGLGELLNGYDGRQDEITYYGMDLIWCRQ